MLYVKRLLTKLINSVIVTQVNATITNGSALYRTIYKFGNFRLLQLGVNSVTGLSSGTWVTIGTVPSDCVPLVNAEGTSFVAGAYGFVRVTTDGNIQVQTTGSATSGIVRMVIPYFCKLGGI